MKRRIYFSFLGLLLACVFVLTTALSVYFYHTAKNREIAAVRDHASLVADMLNSGLNGDIHFSDFISVSPVTSRITIIDPEGTVLLDSRADASSLENHRDRTEVMEALRVGTGEAMRASRTLGDDMYYYAIRLNDGNVLRFSFTIRSIAGVFYASLPVILVVALLIFLSTDYAARKMTKGIMAPLEMIDLDRENTAVYEEMVPYVKKINGQKQEIDEKIAALRDRAETIEAITNNMQEGLILIDKNGGILTANKGAREVFGDWEQKGILHLYRDADFQQRVKNCLAGAREEWSLEREGKIFQVFLSPVRSDGAISGAVILFHDATEKHLAEQQRREFSANVSHELKTPLTTISALAEMIENGMAKENDVKSFAARISEQTGRLIRVIEEIIRLSRFDEGNLPREEIAFDLRELAETVIDAFADNDKSVAIELTGEGTSISANRNMLDELLTNLIDNGIKYNINGGKVTVSLFREGSWSVISVSDTGIGIPEEHREHVFERFYRVDKSRSKKTGGTGLGLSIVKHIVEYHEGKIELESEEGKGTRITCYFPG